MTIECDTCRYYQWYYDKCEKYDCEVDGRSRCAAYEPRGEDNDR